MEEDRARVEEVDEIAAGRGGGGGTSEIEGGKGIPAGGRGGGVEVDDDLEANEKRRVGEAEGV